jgi:flagellar biogenesis protein FliO
MIGVAPLVTGGIFVAFAGVSRLGLNVIWVNLIQGQINTISPALKYILTRPDFWLWLYLTFTVSSTMMPSASDRRAWLPLILLLVSLLGFILLIGVGPWLLSNFGYSFMASMDAVTMIFGITVIIHLILLPPTWILRKMISRLVRLQVV